MTKTLLFIAFLIVIGFIMNQVYKLGKNSRSQRRKTTIERIEKIKREIEDVRRDVHLDIQERERRVNCLKAELEELRKFVEKVN